MYADSGRRKKIVIIILCLVVLAVIATGLYIIASRIETSAEKVPVGAGSSVTTPVPDVDESETATVYYDGASYVYNDELYTLLILGIDDTELTFTESSRNTSQADLVVLAVFDPESSECTMIQLNRDTLLDVPVPNSSGKISGYRSEPLALSHTYGSGAEDSCINTVKTVSRYLYGIEIDNYFSFTMDSIPVFNDLVGGVTVPVEDDFSAVDSTLIQGTTVTLDAGNVEHYVRARSGMDDQTNVNRMARQRHFLDGLSEGLRERIRQDPSFVIDAYGALAESLVTDCTIEELSALADRFSTYTVAATFTPDGETVRGEKYLEFHADEEQLRQLVLDVFFSRADG